MEAIKGIGGGMPQMDQLQQMMSAGSGAQAPQPEQAQQEAPAQFNIQDKFTPSGEQ